MRQKMKALGSVDVPVRVCLSAQAALVASVEWGSPLVAGHQAQH